MHAPWGVRPSLVPHRPRVFREGTLSVTDCERSLFGAGRGVLDTPVCAGTLGGAGGPRGPRAFGGCCCLSVFLLFLVC